MTARTKFILGAAVVLGVLAAGSAVFALTRPPADVSNPEVEFREEPTVTAVPSAIPEEPEKGSKKADPLRNFVWAGYGYSKDRRKYLPASSLLHPPYWWMWSYTGGTLLEFPPVMAEGKLFVLKNNGSLHAIDKRTGKRVWAKRMGRLAEEVAGALLLQHQQAALDGADRDGGGVAVLGHQLLAARADVVGHRAQVFQVEQRHALVGRHAEHDVEHALLRVVQLE